MLGIPEAQKLSAAKVWGAFVSIAMSAQLRGWTHIQFTEEVTRQERRNIYGTRRWTRHKLWIQLDDFSRDKPHAFKSLDSAWDQATANLTDSGMRTPEDLKTSAIKRAWQWTDRIAADTDGFDDIDKRVMDYVITSVEERGLAHVTCPARAAAEHAKISAMTARRRLLNLAAHGFLVQHSPGWYSADSSSRRAAIYSLGDPEIVLTAGNPAAET
ncbi:hypothetical protein CE197_18540 [Mycobacterium intracellulare subsp. chimaera]|nr:hypothetical protein CE197_18540 [Mycobacterium intracellulare subsp. chimaera]